MAGARCFLGCPNDLAGHIHMFPNPERFPDQFNKWVEIIGGQLNTPDDYEFFARKRLCDRHFTEKDQHGNNRLNALAVPSLFLKGEPEKRSKTTTTVSETLAEIDADVPLLQTIFLIDSSGGTPQKMDAAQSIRLIQLYREHRLLWDRKDPNHYRSNKKREQSWIQIANEMNLPVDFLKRKMESLLSAHRRERYKEKKSRLRGAKCIYTSKWFAYSHFDFMRNSSRQVETLHTIQTDDSLLSPQTSNEDTNDTSSSELLMLVEEPPHRTLRSSRQPSRKKRRKSPETSQEESNSEYEDNSLTQSSQVDFLQETCNVVNDAYISFGNHIACELRKYDPLTLACVKHAINNIIFEADMGNIQVNTSDQLAHHSPQIVKLSPPHDSSCS